MANPYESAITAKLTARQNAIQAAGWTGAAAHALILAADTDAEFQAALANANHIRDLAGVVRKDCEAAGITDIDQKVQMSVAKGLTYTQVREAIRDTVAQHQDADDSDDEDAADVFEQRQIEATGRKRATISASDVFARRKAEAAGE